MPTNFSKSAPLPKLDAPRPQAEASARAHNFSSATAMEEQFGSASAPLPTATARAMRDSYVGALASQALVFRRGRGEESFPLPRLMEGDEADFGLESDEERRGLLGVQAGDHRRRTTGALVVVAQEGGLSMTNVTINLVKCAVGAGSFSVPYAFKSAGLWAGVIGTLVLGLLSCYTVELLTSTEKAVVRRSGSGMRLTYPEVAARIFPRARIGNTNVVEAGVYFGICMTAIGACAAYCVFIASTMPTVASSLKEWEVILIMAPMLCALAYLRSFKYLAFTSILGDVAVTTGIIATLVYAGTKIGRPSSDVPSYHLSGIGPGMANLAFLFLSHIVVIPMSQSLKGDMADESRFKKVTRISYVFITVLNLLFGVLCFTMFKSTTEDNVIQNLSTGVVLQIVRVLLCVDLLFTVPMILAVGRELVEGSVLATDFGSRHEGVSRIVVRTLLVAILLGLSHGVIVGSNGNAFGNVVTLIGGLFNFSLGFILPCTLHMVLKWRDISIFSVLGHTLIALLGLVLLGSSTFYTLRDMIENK